MTTMRAGQRYMRRSQGVANMDGTIERRRWPRLPLEADVAFRRKRETYYPLSMCDLTPQGCRVASRERLFGGEMVWVRLPSLESMSGRVKWSAEWQSGVEFNRPMHAAVFDMITRRLAPANDWAQIRPHGWIQRTLCHPISPNRRSRRPRIRAAGDTTAQ
jgi:hypothetical protein